MLRRKDLLLTSLLLLSGLAFGEAGWTDYVAVAELVPTARHYYQFRLPVSQNPSGCRDKTLFYQDYSAFGSDKAFTSLLEALGSGLRVRVFVTGGCNLDGASEISALSVVR